ncbi:HAD hydrolase family protein [Pelagibacterales bacterium SAG-MED27]|nr:HAD hydrolase family protein [Pelagibacterales bacterium SAG-MED27]|tara:strand:+ start:271 stop:795 length:525 start_codon:yes stop_codon:yes gene_type:complete
MKNKPLVFLLDVDGVMTNGQFIYSNKGKIQKIFGPDDHDGLSILSEFIEIRFITGDRKGFDISKKRIVDDMNFKLNLVSTVKRLDWIKKNYSLKRVIYMGDGILDYLVMDKVFYSISPANGHEFAKKSADYITRCNGGERAVAEASLHIMKKFFEKFDQIKGIKNKSFSGSWKL